MEPTPARFIIKLVFGNAAIDRHVNGATDEEVRDEGDIVEVEYETKAEFDAFMEGVEMASGWMDYCIYNEHLTEV